MIEDKFDIKEVSKAQVNNILNGLQMIMEQYPCKASELRKDHPERIQLAEIEAMYLVLSSSAL